MNKILQGLIQENLQIEIFGKKMIHGTLIDVGSNIIVVFNGTDYIYVPIYHIQNFQIDDNNEYSLTLGNEQTGLILEESKKENLTIRKVLTQAKGMFVEIYVTSGSPLHGYITSIMNNYFVFHSPIYKNMYITLKHLKWLIPYSTNERPYQLPDYYFSVQTKDVSLARTFEVQVEKFIGKMVIFDIGDKEYHIGKINNIEEQIVEIQPARGKPIYLNLHHIKTLHQI